MFFLKGGVCFFPLGGGSVFFSMRKKGIYNNLKFLAPEILGEVIITSLWPWFLL